MKRIRYLLCLMLPVILALVVSGCRREEKAPPGRQGELRASQTYVEYFGDPPTVAEGTCYALVGFYPLAEEPEKLSPFPLFLFNKEHQMEIVTEQLLRWGEGWDMGGIMTNPFPPETELLSLRQEQDLVRVELSSQVREETDDARQKVILDVIGHTLAQFEGVTRVMVVAGGALLPSQAERGFMPDPAVVVPPGPPQAVAVAGTWETGQTDPEDVSVFFDRPVTVKEVRVVDDNGRRIEGEYFQAVFDMAVVIHPNLPSAIREGMPIQVTWQVTDRLGRKGKGEKTFPLTRVEHP